MLISWIDCLLVLVVDIICLGCYCLFELFVLLFVGLCFCFWVGNFVLMDCLWV